MSGNAPSLDELAEAETLIVVGYSASRPRGEGHEVDVWIVVCEGPHRLASLTTTRRGKFAEQIMDMLKPKESCPARLRHNLTKAGHAWYSVYAATEADHHNALEAWREWAEQPGEGFDPNPMNIPRIPRTHAEHGPLIDWSRLHPLAEHFYYHPDDPQFQHPCRVCGTTIVIRPGDEQYPGHTVCTPCGLKEVRAKSAERAMLAALERDFRL